MAVDSEQPGFREPVYRLALETPARGGTHRSALVRTRIRHPSRLFTGSWIHELHRERLVLSLHFTRRHRVSPFACRTQAPESCRPARRSMSIQDLRRTIGVNLPGTVDSDCSVVANHSRVAADSTVLRSVAIFGLRQGTRLSSAEHRRVPWLNPVIGRRRDERDSSVRGRCLVQSRRLSVHRGASANGWRWPLCGHPAFGGQCF
jgi:hypothetical protein